MIIRPPSPDTPAEFDAAGVRPGPRSSSARFALRAATAKAHETLDHAYSRFRLDRVDEYSAFLVAHAAAFLPVERALDDAGAAALSPGWAERRRSDALIGDLAALGLPAPDTLIAPTFDSPAQILGAAYVLEGSRLGGAMLLRTVGPGLPTSFLTPGNPADWRAFIALLDEKLSSAPLLEDAASSALAVFSLFERSARFRHGAYRP